MVMVIEWLYNTLRGNNDSPVKKNFWMQWLVKKVMRRVF